MDKSQKPVEHRRRDEEQIDWINELYEVVADLRSRVHSYELRLRKLERKVVDELGDDDEEG